MAAPNIFTGNQRLTDPPSTARRPYVAEPMPAEASETFQYYNSESGMAGIKSVKGIMRLLAVVFSLISFSTMAAAHRSRNYNSFEFVVGICAATFVYSICMLLCYYKRMAVDLRFPFLPIFELVVDGIFAVVLLAAGADSAAKFSKYAGQQTDGTNSHALIISGIFFVWILFGVVGFTLWLSFKENREGEQVNRKL